MKALMGRKVGMTRIFTAEGRAVPVTVVQAGPCVVTQVKTVETDGYEAVQLGFDRVAERKVTKPLNGHMAKAGKGSFRFLREVRRADEDLPALGDELGVEVFAKGDKIHVTGKTKGRGFQGVMKRHNYKGGRATHGSRFHRRPGSIGMCQDPGKTLKGKALPGHMGDKRVTVKSLEVVDVLPDKGVILVKGAVPGGKAGVLFIRGV